MFFPHHWFRSFVITSNVIALLPTSKFVPVAPLINQAFISVVISCEPELVEMAEEIENQIADTEEAAAAAIEGSEGGIIQVQQSEVASSEVGGFKLGGTVDVSISDKMFVDPMWVQSFEQRLCDNKAEIYEEPSLENYTEKIQRLTSHRVPKCLREVKEEAFLPQVVSIGPFHYEKRSTDLHAMEEHKTRYLKDIRSRIGNGCLERFLAAVKLLEDQARACYSEEFVHLDSNSFVEMMVLDGCFIIELFRRAHNKNVDDDPLLDPELRRELAIDLLKLENQIPFVVLHHLFGLMNLTGLTVYKLAINFFDSFQPNYNSITGLFSHFHLLHFLQCSLCPQPMETLEMGDVEMRHSASKLQLAGIKINKGTADSFLSIKFQKEKAVMEVPPFPFEGNTIQVLFNLVAMEQSNVSLYYSYFTAYTAFMNCLSNSADDVRFLCQSGIFDNSLRSKEVAVDLFNNITRNVSLLTDDFYLVNVINDINQCYGSKWHIRRAQLKRNLSSGFQFAREKVL